MGISERVTELLNKYPSLHTEEESAEQIKLAGTIKVHRSIGQFILNKIYCIEVYVPIAEEDLPYVIYTGCDIDSKYPHIYKDGKLCLATDIDLRLAFNEDASLVSWMRNFVEPFFVTYEYYERYGNYPNGDRSHGAKGIVQSYMDIFKVNEEQALNIILFLTYNQYRGHMQCPCGSAKKIRDCHGEKLFEIYGDTALLNQVRKDCDSIVQELNSFKSRYNGNRY